MLATKHSCDLVVIGGGATGVGVVRDAAMRGLSAILVERVDLAQGTTGRYHGLLHSGGRYVVSDPHSATECAEENAILKRIHPDAVECTGGLFVAVVMSDVIQISVFKATGKRVFRMAPLHHHFELLGWKEVTIVIRFWLIAAIIAVAGAGAFYAEWVSAR